MKKDRKKDRNGAVKLIGIFSMVMIIIIAFVGVMYVSGEFDDPTGGYDPPLKEGDTKEDHPIFAYFSVSAEVRFNNGEWFGNHVIYGLEGLEVYTVGAPGEGVPKTNIFQKFMDLLNGHDAPYTLQFAIDGPTEAGYYYPHTVKGEQYVGSGQNIVKNINMGVTAEIRYEGWYHITVTLYDGDGEEVSSLSVDKEVKK